MSGKDFSQQILNHWPELKRFADNKTSTDGIAPVQQEQARGSCQTDGADRKSNE